MSKGKKAGKASADPGSNWDEGLINEVVEDASWRPCLVFLSPNHPLLNPHLQALLASANGGNRRRFVVLEREAMLQSAREDSKLTSAPSGGGGKRSKQTSAVPTDRPKHMEVCEQVATALGSGGEVPAALVARMLKYKVFKKRTQDIARREALRKEAAEAQKSAVDVKGGKKAAGSGQTSKAAGGKKGKETPAPEATPSIPLPQKPPTSMKKRGEEDLDSKYIDDEPADGPSCYFLLTGFTSADFFKHLAQVKVAAHALVSVVGSEDFTTDQGTPNENEESLADLDQQVTALSRFWSDLSQVIQTTPPGSMLRDMAKLELTVTAQSLPDNDEEKATYGQSLFDSLASMLYHMMEQYKQYQHYLGYLDLNPLPLGLPTEGSGETSESPPPDKERPTSSHPKPTGVPSVDMRYYNELLSAVPEGSVNIPLIVHCMLEQVSATLSGPDTKHDAQNPVNGVHPAVIAGIDGCITSLALPTQEKKGLLTNPTKLDHSAAQSSTCVTFIHGDTIKQQAFHLKSSEQLKISESATTVNQRSVLAAILSPPALPREEELKQGARIHALEHFCTSADVSPEMLNYALILLSLEHIILPAASSAPLLKYSPTHHQQMLLFDYPFNLPLKERRAVISHSGALVPYPQANNAEIQNVSGSETTNTELSDAKAAYSLHMHALDTPQRLRNLEEYCVCEHFTKDVLIQLVQNLLHTHPYLEMYYHNHSQSIVLVLHTGFNGNLIHKYEWSSRAHSRVGFQNYLQFVAEKYGAVIDKATVDDTKEREKFEKERKQLIEEKLKVLQEQDALPDAKEMDPKTSGKDGKKGSAASSAKKTPAGKSSPDKRSKLGSTECTPAASTLDVTASEADLPEFRGQKLFIAYDVGDRVLLNRGCITTQFTADGAQIRTEVYKFLEGQTSIKASVLHNDHTISVSILRETQTSNNDTQAENVVYQDGNTPDSKDETSDANTEGINVAGIPQPPKFLSYASLQASFSDSLTISLSHYGPAGNGNPPYEPKKPEILQESSTPVSAAGSHPQSQQGTSPQKLTKKQQEQQQQLLEQQKLLEQQQAKQRKSAEEKYQKHLNALLRHNKYQQLFASTPFGLHIHCQIMVDLELDPATQDGSDGYIIIRQTYPSKASGKQTSEEIVLEAENHRCYLPDGSVVRLMCDKTMIIECSDGSIYRTATKSETQQFMAILQPSSKAPDEEQTQEIAEEAAQRIASATKVSFANEKLKSTMSQDDLPPKEVVWVVTTPTGKQYLWKSKDSYSSDSIEPQEHSTAAETTAQQVLVGHDESEASNDTKATSTVVPLRQIEVFPATDPVTKETVITREDGVTLLHRPDGSYVAEHADGTRFTTLSTSKAAASNKASFQVIAECPGFARVVHYPDSQTCKLDFPDGAQILCSNTGSYTVAKESSYELDITSEGKAQYTLVSPPNQELTNTYIVDHTSCSELIQVSDTLGNQYSVTTEGKSAAVFSSGKMKELPHHPAFSPKYFVVQSDGTAYELLRKEAVDAVVANAEKNPTAVVVRDTLLSEPHCTSTTIIEKGDSSGISSVPYCEHDIIPVNIRSNSDQPESYSGANDLQDHNINNGLKKRFGVKVGRVLRIGSFTKPTSHKPLVKPTSLKYRKFVHYVSIKHDTREKILASVAQYIAWYKEEGKKADGLMPVDDRKEDEKLAAEELHEQWSKTIATKLNFSELQLCDQYIEAASKRSSLKQSKLPPQHKTRSDCIVKGKKELENSKAIKAALRQHHVPPYFKSEECKPLLRTQSPDLPALASKLAQPKHAPVSVGLALDEVGHSHSGASTPSTLHSASMTLPPEGEAVSPVQSETDQLGPVSSLTKIRPSHPTPDHAHGNRTPTDVRPTNPTPSHATKATNASIEEPSVSTSTVGTQISLPVLNLSTDTSTEEGDGCPKNPTPVQAYLGPAERPTSQSSSFVPPSHTDVSFTLPPSKNTKDQESGKEDATSSTSKEVTSPKNKRNSFDVTGKPRKFPVKTPVSIQGGRPGEKPNIKFATVEDPVRRKVHTSSTSMEGVIRGFKVMPEEVDFGVLKEGNMYTYTVTLQNTGIDSCCFKIKQPPPSTGIKVIYTPGPVAAGMSRKFDIEIFAMAVGAVGGSGIGGVHHGLEITTETSILYLDVNATVLTSSTYDNRLPSDPQGKEVSAVQLASDRLTSRDSFTRPPRSQ